MKTYIKYLLLSATTALLFSGAAARAAMVEVTWDEPEKFSDIRANTGNSQRRFEERVIDELTEYFQEAADDYLRFEQTLKIDIHDVDLAGDVEYFFTRFDNEGVRVIRDVYFPSIEFSYQLLNQDDVLIESGTQNVKDMGFHYAGANVVDSAPLGYEKEMIEAWFEVAFDE